MNKPSVQPNQCPQCKGEVRIEASSLFGDMPCPHCDTKLWYLAAANEARFFDYETSAEMRDKTYSFVAERLELERDRVEANPKFLDELDIDSLEALEMLMDLEEELGLV